jgi:hypothetical protein
MRRLWFVCVLALSLGGAAAWRALDSGAGRASIEQTEHGAPSAPRPPRPATRRLLPGEKLWPRGVSNLIFGTIDTGEWGTPNVEFTNAQTAPGRPNRAVQNALRKAGFQLDRMFVSHNDFASGKETSDAEIAARVNTAARIGGQCIIAFSSIRTSHTPPSGDAMTDLQFSERVARLTDGRHVGYAKCRMFEIGNEPDCGGGPFSNGSYASAWALYVRALRAIRPDAKFIGPVECNGVTEMLSFLREIVANHYPVPDAISWHWYPCGWSSESWSSCPLSVSKQIIRDAQTVRSDLRSTLGHQIPIGISEWSADGQASGTKNMAYTEPSMSNFIRASLDAMAEAKLDFAAEFDAQSVAAYGGLDMFSSTNAPRPYFRAYASEIAKYR